MLLSPFNESHGMGGGTLSLSSSHRMLLFSDEAVPPRCISTERASIAFASFVMSETALESRACSLTCSEGSTSGSSPGTNMPPMAAGPADGLRADLPAASPAAETPGFALAMKRVRLLTDSRAQRARQ
jgi:hypothetical protein